MLNDERWPDFSCSVEDWVLMRLDSNRENLRALKLSGEMLALLFGELQTIATCLQFVRITQRHDELAVAFKESVLRHDSVNPRQTALIKQLGVMIFGKLNAEKNGVAVDWEALSYSIRPDNPDADKNLIAAWT